MPLRRTPPDELIVSRRMPEEDHRGRGVQHRRRCADGDSPCGGVDDCHCAGVERFDAGHPIFEEVRECSLLRVQGEVGPACEEDRRR